PEGVTPIEFDTVEEAKEFLEQQEQLQDNATIVEYGEEKAPGWYFRAATANTATKTATFSVTPLSSLKINATYTYANNKFTGVSSVTTSFTGYTSGTEWNQDTYSSTISSDGKKLSVTVYGHFDYYLLINTKLTKLGAKDEQYSASWNY
ncbi:MAG: hypothetical protein IKZ85_03830, partial [Pseudobutyrivibrio sp.]|nr:hypothetical protein [Pseudobutyrivibrio sp.]